MHDEGPNEDDLNRFGDDTAYCPECGGEIWDQAEFCPECGSYLAGRTSSRPPLEREFRSKWIVLIAIIVLIAFILIAVF